MKRTRFVSLGVASTAAVAFESTWRSAAAAVAPPADPLDVAIPAPAWTKTYGNLEVKKYGTGAPALILIPGLSCGAWTWNGTVANESKLRAVYTVGVGGFSGVPPASPDSLDGIIASVAQLISDEKLVKPVLVGHSLGGTTVLKFGIVHPELVRAIVTVDGTPVFPSLAQSPADQRVATAKQIGAAVASLPRDQYLAQQLKTVADFVVDQTLAARVAKLCSTSDQATVGAYSADLFATDLRPDLPKLAMPTLLIAPVPANPLPSYLPAVMATLDDATRTSATSQFYAELFKGAPHLTIVTIPNARHFVMLDQPAPFSVALDNFLAGIA